MNELSAEQITVSTFSRMFEQMCNFVAVAKTGDPQATLRGIVTLCLLEFPDDHFNSSTHFCEKIADFLGLIIPEHQLEESLEYLERRGVVTRPAGTNYKLSQEASIEIQKNSQIVRDLEARVQAQWFEELKTNYPTLPVEQAWVALKGYLARTFRRHGVQTAALLDPTIDTPAENDMSLSTILREAIATHLPADLRKVASRAIPEFFALVGTDSDRSSYVAQLADGAFNFYTLEVPIELSNRLQAQLKEMTVFLDTNFLFGIMDLHYNAQVQVSHDLVHAITENKIPFKLRYHEATGQEMMRTISHHGDYLRSRSWTLSLSRAASKTRNLSGIEQKFHECNAGRSIDVDEFLRPYEHFDQMLEEKDIKVYRPRKTPEHDQQAIDLYHDYRAFLEKNRRGDKTYETVMHDATVLAQARRLRTDAKSTLDAGALIVTCDYFLYRFDWETARKNGHRACVLLPNIFWQILRPFIPVNQDFEKAFAETFALPEFRAIGSGGGKACSRMIQILAAYKDVPEQTAFKLMSNDLLLDRLRATENDIQFAEQVEIAFVEENRGLLEEKVALEIQLQDEQQRRENEASTRDKERHQYQQEQNEKTQSLAVVREELDRTRCVLEDHQQIAESATQRATQAEIIASNAIINAEKAEKAEKSAFKMSVVAGFALGILLAVVFEAYVYMFPWKWLVEHSKSISLQISIDLMLLTGSTGLLVTKWRKWLWLSGLVPLLLLILSLL